MIEIWAKTFSNQPDLNGVSQVYTELKNKGIQFPNVNEESAPPIFTPQRVNAKIVMINECIVIDNFFYKGCN